MKTNHIYGILGMIVVMTLCPPPYGYASMGQGSGAMVYETLDDEWNPGPEKGEPACGVKPCDCVEVPWDPSLVTVTPAEPVGRAPLTVTFTYTPENDAECYVWRDGDGNPYTTAAFTHTYLTFRKRTVTLLVVYEGGGCKIRGKDVVAELPAPSQEDINQLLDLQSSFTGMRALIASHPTRSDFRLGVAEFEGVWYGPPLLHDFRPCAPCSSETPDLDRHWATCPCPNPRPGGEGEGEGEGSCDYCESDPKAQDLRVDYGHLPLESTDLKDYLAFEFNMLGTINSLQPPAVSRRGILNSQNGEFDVQWSYAILDNMVRTAQGMNMDMYGVHLLYWLPAWTAYGGALGYLTPQKQAGVFDDHLTSVLTHYTAGEGEGEGEGETPLRFAYWGVANEVLKDRKYAWDDPQDPGSLLRWDCPMPFWPGTAAGTTINPSYWWPWFLLADPVWTGEGEGETPHWEANHTDYAASQLKHYYRETARLDPNAHLVCTDYEIEFRYQEPGEGEGEGEGERPREDQPKYRRALKLVDFFQSGEGEGEGEGESGPVPLYAYAIQMHIPAWSVLKYDPGEGEGEGEGELRLNPNQLKGLRDSVRGFEEKGLKVILSEMDVRMGIPQNPDPLFPVDECKFLKRHLADDPLSPIENVTDYTPIWTGAGSSPRTSTLAFRTEWQGKVYEAVLNACLAVPALHGVIFFDLSDETSWLDATTNANEWPFTDPYPEQGASRPSLFGDNPGTYAGEGEGEGEGESAYREMFYPKLAYYGVRAAVLNYFGPAFTVTDASGQEVMRFVKNGNVLLMKEKAQIDEDFSGWQEIMSDPDATRFVVKNADGAYVAALTPMGHLYLKGKVFEGQTGLAVPQPPDPGAFVIKNKSGTVVSLIDSGGNLKMYGHLLIDGIPYDLLDCNKIRETHYETTDHYFSY